MFAINRAKDFQFVATGVAVAIGALGVAVGVGASANFTFGEEPGVDTFDARVDIDVAFGVDNDLW